MDASDLWLRKHRVNTTPGHRAKFVLPSVPSAAGRAIKVITPIVIIIIIIIIGNNNDGSRPPLASAFRPSPGSLQVCHAVFNESISNACVFTTTVVLDKFTSTHTHTHTFKCASSPPRLLT